MVLPYVPTAAALAATYDTTAGGGADASANAVMVAHTVDHTIRHRHYPQLCRFAPTPSQSRTLAAAHSRRRTHSPGCWLGKCRQIKTRI